MHRSHMPFRLARRLLTALLGSIFLTCWGAIPLSSQAVLANASSVRHVGDYTARSGVSDFDFLIGRWKVHHRRLNKRLSDSNDWTEFEGTLVSQKVLGGSGNIDDNLLNQPGGAYHAVAIRAFDEKSGQWSIWWLDGRAPGASLEPAVHGGFKDGVGLFYAEDTLNGRPILVRYIWSEITPESCRWEQAFSPDHGGTWEVNWIMKFTRVE